MYTFPVTDVNIVNKEIYYKFYPLLVASLPMKDAIFVSHLVTLLPGNLKEKVESKPTQAEAAACFLDNGITPAVETGEDESFRILLSVMEVFGSIHLQCLAQKIEQKIQKKLQNQPLAGENDNP